MTYRYLLRFFQVVCGSDQDLNPPENLNWVEFLDLVEYHALIPQLASLLPLISGAQNIPESVFEEIRHRQRRTARTHLAALSSLGVVRRVLLSHRIPYVVLKGPALSHTLYGRDARRAYGDLDVLVKKTDRDRAMSALRKADFQPYSNRAVQQWVRRTHFNIELVSSRPGHSRVELHWALVDSLNLWKIDSDKVFSRQREVLITDPPIPALELEDELIYLSVHIAKHGVLNAFGLDHGKPAEWFCRRETDNRLRWLLDIHELVNLYGNELDWDVVYHRMESWSVSNEVVASLRLLDLLAPQSAGHQALSKLGAEINTKPVSRPSFTRLFVNSKLGQHILEKSLVTIPGLSFRWVRFLFFGRELFPSLERMRRYYGFKPVWLMIWFYISHPFRLALKTLK